MIKCNQCNALYAESAKFCLYCKIALPSAIGSEAAEFDFEFNQVATEGEANQIKMQLLQKEVVSKTIAENDQFKIMIAEKDKLNAFREIKGKTLFLNNATTERKSGKNTKIVTYLVLFVLAVFSFLFLRLKSTNNVVKEKIIYEGTVDTRIMPRETRVPAKNGSTKPNSTKQSTSKSKTKPPASH